MILVIDNYDSFTYNLVQYMGELGADLLVKRNDAITVDEIAALEPEKIVLSPGPCTPDEAGVSLEVVRAFSGNIPILGVCLGHQAIGQAFGGRVVRAPKLFHGKVSEVYHNTQSLYRGIPNPFIATRYHSLVVERETLPDCLEITSWTEDGVIMGFRHKEHPTEGVQFHPESILTLSGKEICRNFLEG